MTMASELTAGFNTIMMVGGTACELYSPDSTLKITTKGAFVNWTSEDEALRNDYDKEAQKFYLPNVTPAPKKQDYILAMANRWTVLDVHTRIVDGTIICHVCIVRK